MLLDSLIRAALIPRLRFQYQGEQPRIVDEMVIWGGTVRVDVAVVGDKLRGYEIKSDADTLRRLPNQAKYYNESFDEMTLVVGKKYRTKALPLIPEWWGVTAVEYQDGVAFFTEDRAPAANPGIKPLMLARYLWKMESIAILQKRGLAKGVLSKRSSFLQRRVAENLSLDELREELLTTLKARPVGWHLPRYST